MHGWMPDQRMVEERREEIRREVETYRLARSTRGESRGSFRLAALGRELRLDLTRLASLLGVSGGKRKGAW